MMREILFRGKRIANGEWYYGSYLFLHKSPVDWTGAERGKPEDVHYIINDQDINYAVDPSTVGQYTGLTDKNGKRIFEGDVCQTKGIPLIDEKPFVAVWNDYYSGFYWENIDNPRETDMFTQTVAELTEVIGNIHDNPELLKEAET